MQLSFSREPNVTSPRSPYSPLSPYSSRSPYSPRSPHSSRTRSSTTLTRVASILSRRNRIVSEEVPFDPYDTTALQNFVKGSFPGATLLEEHQVSKIPIEEASLISTVLLWYWPVPEFHRCVLLLFRAQWPTRYPHVKWLGPLFFVSWRDTRRNWVLLTTASAKLLWNR